MELKRVLANDIRAAKEEAWSRFGKDVLILSNERVNGRVELIVATDMSGGDADDALPPPESGRTDKTAQTSGPGFSSHFNHALSAFDGTADVAARSEPAEQILAERERRHHAADSMRAAELVAMIRGELDQIRQEFRTAKSLMAWNRSADFTDAIRDVAAAMQDANIPFTLRTLLLDEIQSCETADAACSRIRSILDASLNRIAAPAPCAGVHVIAGPSGAGKSHMAGRLAGLQSATLKAEDIAIISYKDQRTGAWPQIQLIGCGTGVDVYRARNEAMLSELVANLSEKALLIVDTPGHKCLDHAAGIRAHLPTAGFHLSIPADASVAALRRLVDESQVQWQSLMITKADECVNAWPLLELLTRQKAAVSFVGDVAINGELDVLERMLGQLTDVSLQQLRARPMSSAYLTADRSLQNQAAGTN